MGTTCSLLNIEPAGTFHRVGRSAAGGSIAGSHGGLTPFALTNSVAVVFFPHVTNGADDCFVADNFE